MIPLGCVNNVTNNINIYLQVHNHGIDHMTAQRMADDTLHTMALGVETKYNAKVLAHALDLNVFGVHDDTIADKRLQGCRVLQRQIGEYYKRIRREYPHYNCAKSTNCL